MMMQYVILLYGFKATLVIIVWHNIWLLVFMCAGRYYASTVAKMFLL